MISNVQFQSPQVKRDNRHLLRGLPPYRTEDGPAGVKTRYALAKRGLEPPPNSNYIELGESFTKKFVSFVVFRDRLFCRAELRSTKSHERHEIYRAGWSRNNCMLPTA